MMQKTQSFLAIGGLALVVIGIVTGKQNLSEIRSIIAASKWPSFDGKIESSGVSESSDYGAANASKRATFSIVIRYSYRFGGRTYTSERSGFDGRIFFSFSSAQRASSLYANQKTIKVYVSPEDPTRSVIGVGMQWRRLLAVAVSGALVAVGVTMILALFGVYA